MSKKRDKKTPMFVSNINSNYQFVDYTGPGELGPAQPSSFGNPNLVPPSQPYQQSNRKTVPSQVVASPKKQNNWFEQMLQAQQIKSLPSIYPPKTGINQVVMQSPINQTQKQTNSANLAQNNQNYSQPFQTLGQNNTPFQPGYNPSLNSNSQQQTQNVQPSFKKQVAPSANQYNMATQSPMKPSQGIQQGITSPNNNNYNNYGNYQNAVTQQQQQKPYEFKTANITIQQKSNNYAYNQNQSQPVQKQKPIQAPVEVAQNQNKYNYKLNTYESSYQSKNKYQSVPTQSSSYKNSSSSGGSGFTDESIAEYLPEPARSNILAMIRRNKANN